MSDASTRHMLEMYEDEADPPLFLAGFFQSPERNFHTSEKVELDIVREDADVAIVVQDLRAGGRYNEASKYTNKGFTPPVFKEIFTFGAPDLITRPGGSIDFTDPNFNARVVEKAFHGARLMQRKISRSVEMMASQVLQTGALTLVDSTGVALYNLDFQAKSTHKITVGATWATDGTTGDPLGDVAAAAQVVRRDGKRKPTKLLMGTSALQRFLANGRVQKALDKNGQNIGALAPTVRGEGATFQGWVWVGNYRFEIWTYDGFYRHPQTGNLTDYIDTNNVIMLSDGGRLDLSFGAIPTLLPPAAEIAAFLPPRLSSTKFGFDLSLNAWVTENREHLNIQVGGRPLTIPSGIDTFACIKVTA
jgi:hypothetical protein